MHTIVCNTKELDFLMTSYYLECLYEIFSVSFSKM